MPRRAVGRHIELLEFETSLGRDEPDGSQHFLLPLSEQPIQRACDTEPILVQNVRVDHSRPDVLVAEQLLYRTDVGALFQHVGCKRMAQALTRCIHWDAGQPDCFLDLHLKRPLCTPLRYLVPESHEPTTAYAYSPRRTYTEGVRVVRR